MSSDIVLLHHILECIRRIEEHAAAGRDQFFQSHTLQDATLRNLQVLAESSRRLSQALKESQPLISWTGIAGFRNVLVHDYLGIELSRVWSIVQNDVPELKSAATVMLDSLKPTDAADAG